MEMAQDGDEKRDDASGEKAVDVVLLQGPTEDGEGVRVLRAREDRLEVGEVRPLKEGQPLLAGEVVKLAPRAGSRVCDVEVLAKIGAHRGATPAQIGPAQVATREYRESWDRIFGPPKAQRELLN